MVVIDAVDTPSVAASALAGMADDMGAAEPGLYTVVIDMDAQALADQARGGAVEDAVHQEAAGTRDAGNDFGEVGGAPGRQRPQRCGLDPHGGLAAAIAPRHELVDEPAPVGKAGEVAAAAQDQSLVERGLEMAVVRFHRPVLMRLAGIAAAGDQAVMGAELLVPPCHVLRRLAVKVAVCRGEAVGAVLARDAA